MADPYRFPWIAASRIPSARELRAAIETTMTMHATQSLQTERRGHGKIVEQRLEARLIELGFVKVSGQTAKKPKKDESSIPILPAYPAKGRITQPSHHPAYPYFYGECVVYGRKVDLFISLSTGVMIALETKDSSSGLNSTKRLLNDTTAKAKHYATEAGKNIISVALLSGVFKLSDLKAAQIANLYLVCSEWSCALVFNTDCRIRNMQALNLTWLVFDEASGVVAASCGADRLAQIAQNSIQSLIRHWLAWIEAMRNVEVARLRGISNEYGRAPRHLGAKDGRRFTQAD